MKKTLRVILMLMAICWVSAVIFAGTSALASEIGSFFTQVNTYGFTDAPQAGKRFLVRARQAFMVIDITSDGESRRWVKIRFPKIESKISGEGWTPLAPHEILNNATRLVEIYQNNLESKGDQVSSVLVQASDLKLLNINQPSTKYPNIIWQKVQYTTRNPVELWVREGTGIFRPGKTVTYLSQVYADMVSRSIEKKIQVRLLSGVVRVGDSQAEVEWALGKPLRVRDENVGNVKKIIWQYAAMTVRFNNLVVEKIN